MANVRGSKTVVFVHGTGVRKKKFDKYLARITSMLEAQPAITVMPGYWGDLGADLHHQGASVPQYDTTRGLAGDEDDPVRLWGLLYDDPLYELRLWEIAAGARGEPPPGRVSPGAELDRRLAELTLEGELKDAIDEAGIADVFEPARRTVRASRPYRDGRRQPSDLSAFRGAVARAIVAQASRDQDESDEPPMDGVARDRVVAALLTALGGTDRVLGGRVGRQAFDIAMQLGGTQYLRRRRRSLTDASYPGAGDILLYLARGQRIRERIAEGISQAGDDVVVLAHSLGGIMSVDLLALQALPQVRLLVTVGSQAPFLYEIDALPSLRHDEPLPDHFPDWLNVYDLNDLLSYAAHDVFGDRVRDLRVDNGQPFPKSHSAYWANRTMWQALAPEMA